MEAPGVQGATNMKILPLPQYHSDYNELDECCGRDNNRLRDFETGEDE
jgi:hypothetical protein